jgi:hypothetical protein
MKQSQVKPGVRAMLSLGRRGAVAVTVVRERFAAGTINDRAFWIVADSHGTEHYATARQLQPMPAPYVSTPSERAHASAFRCASDAMAQVIHLMSVGQ